MHERHIGQSSYLSMYVYDVDSTGPLKNIAEVAQKSIVRLHRCRIPTRTCVYILRHKLKLSSLAAHNGKENSKRE